MYNIKKRLSIWAVIIILLLSVPFVAMQFTKEVNWDLFDFIFMGTLLFGVGLAYEFAARKTSVTTYRTAIGFALGAAFLLIWINGAVGIIGSENNPANLMYFAVLIVGIIGALITRLEAKGMVKTLFATALTQAFVPIIAFIIWKPDFTLGVIQVFFLNTIFVLLFTISALLFRQAGSEPNKAS